MMMRRWTLRIGLFYMLGVVVSVGMAWVLAATLDVQQGRVSVAQMYDGDHDWVVQRYDRAGAVSIQSVRSRPMAASWSCQQASGAPDTQGAGDIPTAWASASQDTGTEWLLMEYAKVVTPKEVHVYETYNPGALFKVAVIDAEENELTAWEGVDPTPVGSGRGTSKIAVSLGVPTKRVKIYLASDKVPGWNEIDAVGLLSDADEMQWAKKVSASSTYASGRGAGPNSGDPNLLITGWSGLGTPLKALVSEQIGREERVVDARGWPFLSMMSARDASAGPGGVGGAAGQTQPGAPMSGFVQVSSTLVATTPTGTGAPTPIPLRPIWPGLLASGTFWGAALGGMWAALVIPRRFIREVARFRRGGCVQCGYDLGYDFLNGCPECGWRRDAPNRTAGGGGNGALKSAGSTASAREVVREPERLREV